MLETIIGGAQLWLFHGGGHKKKINGTNHTGEKTPLKLLLGQKIPYFAGLRDLLLYKT